MSRLLKTGLVAALTLAPMVACRAPTTPPPETRRDETVDTLHGVDIADPYRWLEDQESAETRAWIAAQSDYLAEVMLQAPAAETASRRLRELLGSGAQTAPVVRAGRSFFQRRNPGEDHESVYVRRFPDGPDEVLVDPRALDTAGSVSLAAVANDATLIAYAVRRGGEAETEIRFLDVDSGLAIGDVLPSGNYLNVWITADLSGVYYDRISPDGPRVGYHPFGADPANDKLVFGRGYGADKLIYSQLSSNGRYLLVTVGHGAGGTRSELYFADTWAGLQMYPIVSDIDASFTGRIAGDTLFVLTDWEAPNRRIFAANLRQPSIDNWAEIIPAGEHPIETFSAIGRRLVVQRLQQAQPRLTVYEPDGFPVRDVELPPMGTLTLDGSDYYVGLGVPTGTWEEDEVSFVFSALTVPPTVFRYRVSDGMQSPWTEPAVVVDGSQFVVRQVYYESTDGTRVPMFVAHRRDLERNGDHRALLTGYGGFNVSVLPRFDPMALAWMEEGGVWAIANLRGGGEFGDTWHRAGMLHNKHNTFDDFIAAAEWLIDNDYTRASRLAIKGGSNGGLLVGAALTQRPDLFAAAVCAFPLLDMLRYHRFPPADLWVSEYGTSADPVQFEYLAAYSPYHQVAPATRYPAVMLVTGDADTQVAPLHARKMTALLQAANGSSNPIVLRYDEKAGHSSGRPISEVAEELSAELRFLLWQTG